MQSVTAANWHTQRPGVAAVLLAAGESTRMGEMKALLPWRDGQPLIAAQVRALHEAGYGPIVVVVGHEAERVSAALPGDVPVNVIINERYAQGRSSSIFAGVMSLTHEVPDAVLVVSVDQPRSAAMLRSLREAWEREQPPIAVPSLDGRAGHPPIFAGELIPELLQVDERSAGLRQVMRNFGGGRLLVAVDDPLTLTNLNTRADYEAALRALEDVLP